MATMESPGSRTSSSASESTVANLPHCSGWPWVEVLGRWTV
uniref:Uncharacterized protein n=1 Tax=Arundo donax TaxID=35708 RepID=A0A0A9GKH6_ARUDO